MSGFVECACKACQAACTRNPGWFLPEEARLAIAAGYANRMMRDWLEPCSEVGNDERIYTLAAASEDCGGSDAPEIIGNIFSWFISQRPFEKGRCVMLTDQGRCEIHDSGFKPFQCREALLCAQQDFDVRSHPASNYSIARHWDTDLGRAVIEEWQVAVGRES